jgi:Uma2 family endonuclease
MSPVQSQKLFTLAEFLQLPETKPPNEYVKGQIYSKPMPKGKHSLLQTHLVGEINRIIIPEKLAYGFTELRCTFGGQSIVPDITVFTWENIPLDDKGAIKDEIEIAPNWTIEILSPKQSSTLVINNILFCLNYGTELGWLIDPQERLIMIFQQGVQPEIKQNQDKLPVLNRLDNLQLSVQDVFSWLSFN